MKKINKYSIGVFSQVLLGLLAVFYISIFAIEATHSHENFIEVSSSDGEKNVMGAEDCKICAYIAHHQTKKFVTNTNHSFEPMVFQEVALTPFNFTINYQADLLCFTSRGPPSLLI